jgi:hypothetical protein
MKTSCVLFKAVIFALCITIVSQGQNWDRNNGRVTLQKSTDSVGIGVSPTQKLEIQGGIKINNAAGTQAEIRISPTGTASQIRNSIQTAIDAFSGTGGVVILSKNWYVVDGTIFIRQGVMLKGDGMLATTLQINSNATITSIIQMENSSNVGDLGIYYYTQQRVAGQIGICCNALNSKIQNVFVTGFDIGINLPMWSDIVEKSSITSCNIGINIVRPDSDPTPCANNNLIQKCIIQDSYICGIRIRGVGNQIFGNDIDIDTAGWNGRGIRSIGIEIQAPAANSFCNANYIAGNYMEGNALHISISANGNKIIGNWFERPRSWSTAFSFFNGSDASSSGNEIIGNTDMQNYNTVGYSYKDFMLSEKIGIGIVSPDTTLHINGAIALGPTGGPKILSGPNAPKVTAPNGSLYLRTNGTGPNLYVRQNGAWVSK